MNFRAKCCRTRSKFENLSHSAALTQFVKYVSDETPQTHSKNTPKHPKALENYAITRQKTFLTSKTACETHTYTILWKPAMNFCCQFKYFRSLISLSLKFSVYFDSEIGVCYWNINRKYLTVIISKVKMLITAFVWTLKQWDKDISSPPYTLNTT